MWCEMGYRQGPSHLFDMEIALAGLEAVASVVVVVAVVVLVVAFYPAVMGCVDEAIDAVGRMVGRGWASGGEPRSLRRLRRRAAPGWAGPPVDRPAHPR
jgi:hypothetical protein